MECRLDGQVAVVTGGSSGLGRGIALLYAQAGASVVVNYHSGEDAAQEVVRQIEAAGGRAFAQKADVSQQADVEAMFARAVKTYGGVDVLVANSGIQKDAGIGDMTLDDWRRVIDTNVIGTTYLLQKVARDMAARGQGRILITGSIAGLIPGSYQAVYNATKAYLDSFAYALREELKDSGVTITVLMPGPTDTPFFERAGMLDTPVGKDDSKEDPAKTARNGWDAVMAGSAHVVSGAKNKVQAALSHITPDTVLAAQHTKMAKPDGE